MTGPEHYRDAERNLQYAKDKDPGSDGERFHLAMAQAHATLALAAATALQSGGDEMYADDKAAWVTAASEEATRETAPAEDRCPDCGRASCTGEDCYWPDEAGITRPERGAP